MPVATASAARPRRTVSPCPSGHLGAERAGEFIRRSQCHLEGYLSSPDRDRLTRLARLMRRYFPEQWDMEWIRDEIERLSAKRVYVSTAGKNGVQGAAILFLDGADREIACIEIELSEGGEIISKHFSFSDGHPPKS